MAMSDSDRRYEPITGSPNRSTRAEEASGEPSPTDTSGSRDEDPAGSDGAPSGRSRRVAVTPSDWDKLESLAEEFGLPYSKIYNMSFSALLEKLGRKNGTRE
jgi:hypothetical protein